MVSEERIREIAEKIYHISDPSLSERQQIARHYHFRDPEKGLKTKFKPDESYDFNAGSWNKKRQYQKNEDEERKEKIQQAMSYINSTDYKTIYSSNFHQVVVKNRAKEVRYIKEAFDLNFVDISVAINKVLGSGRFTPGDIQYIFKHSGKHHTQSF